MNKFQAMAKIMAILNEDGYLKPGTKVYKIVREIAEDKVARFGPEIAVREVEAKKARCLDQVKYLHVWYKHPGKLPPKADF
jgi:hypothetical protein